MFDQVLKKSEHCKYTSLMKYYLFAKGNRTICKTVFLLWLRVSLTTNTYDRIGR